MDEPSVYDPIAHLYDPWSRSVVEDIDFYVEEAQRAGGPVLELGVGTGRIAVPTAQAGLAVTGVDSSAGMLARARIRAEAAGVELELHRGDFRAPPVSGPFALVTIPFRSILHMRSDSDRRRVIAAAQRLLAPGGRLVFDVFTPSSSDIAETHARWLEREPGIFERADWNAPSQSLTLRVRGLGAGAVLELAWLTTSEWRELLGSEGFVVEGLYGWFDRSPWDGEEDSIWVCRARA
jgi:SAM-dependent methyltransferase